MRLSLIMIGDAGDTETSGQPKNVVEQPVVDDDVALDLRDAGGGDLLRQVVHTRQRVGTHLDGGQTGVGVGVVDARRRREGHGPVRLLPQPHREVTGRHEHEVALHGAVADGAGAEHRRVERVVRARRGGGPSRCRRP